MLSYLTIGANDVEASGRFYRSILVPLGYEEDFGEGQYCYSLPHTADKLNGPGTVHVAKPFDGNPATAGNGMMLAFRADSAKTVNEVHAAGLANGGSNDGDPGTRVMYSPDFYVAYLRDPVGNKVAVFYTV